MSYRDELESKIISYENAISAARRAIVKLDFECVHKWGETIQDDICHKGYTIQGDPPGTMGVDRRDSYYVPAKREERWKRVCDKCGKVEYSSRIKEVKTKVPIW